MAEAAARGGVGDHASLDAARRGRLRWLAPTLRSKILLWTVVLIFVPTWACAAWLNHYARGELSQIHSRNVAMLGHAIAGSVADEMEQGPTAVRAALDALDLDARLAFVAITDASDKHIHRRTPDALAWVAYTDWEARQSASRGHTQIDHVEFLGPQRDLVMRKVPVWESGPRWAAAGGGVRELRGFVVLAVRETSLPAALDDLTGMQIIAAGVICALCLPAVMLAAQRWTAPLRLLLQATRDIAAGRIIEPIAVKSGDELAELADSFYDMAQSLVATQNLLKDANEQLERKVEERTGQLEQARQRLESEIKEKNEFLRAVSHDLGAPLRNISGLAAMLLMKYKTDLAEDAINKLERIRANVTTQVDLINDLMELSRIKSRPGKRQAVDLNELIGQIRESLSYDMEPARIQFDVPRPLPTIFADPNRMRQVFQNLLDNAVKYMLDAKDRRIQMTHVEEDGALHFVVSDTGCGIGSDDLPHVFDVFRRSTRSASLVPGRGVGLAGVKTIIELYGGRIWVESDLGKGSRFHFTLDKNLVGEAVPA